MSLVSYFYSMGKDQMESCVSSVIGSIFLEQSLQKPCLHYNLWPSRYPILYASKFARTTGGTRQKKIMLKCIHKHLKSETFPDVNSIYFQAHQYIWNMTKN